MRLFERGARGTSLTPAGSRFLPYAERVLDLLDEATREVHAVERARPLRIGVHTTFAHRAVPLVLDAIGQPPPKLTVRDAHSDQVIAMLLDGVIDVGFVLPGARPPQLRFVRLPADPVVPVCSPYHDLAGAHRLTLAALQDRAIALNRWGAGAELFTDQLLAAGVAEDQITECSDGVTVLRLAAITATSRSCPDHSSAMRSMPVTSCVCRFARRRAGAFRWRSRTGPVIIGSRRSPPCAAPLSTVV